MFLVEKLKRISRQKVGAKKNWRQKKLAPKKIGAKKISRQKFGAKKICPFSPDLKSDRKIHLAFFISPSLLCDRAGQKTQLDSPPIMS
jgi:hypothetical protein